MPPVPQQGSRAGLISALVITVILLVTVTIYSFYQAADLKRAVQEVSVVQSTYAPAVSASLLTDARFTALVDAGKEMSAQNGGAPMTALEVAIVRLEELSKAVVGGPATSAEALGQIQAAKAVASAKAVADTGVVVSKDGLTPVVGQLAGQVIKLATEKTALSTQIAAAQTETQTVLASQTEALSQRDAQIAELSAKYDAAEGEIAKYRATVDQNVASMGTKTEAEIKRAQDASAQLQQQITAMTATNAGLQREIGSLRGRFANIRIDPKEAIVQVADGRIIRLPGNNNAYINLGSGDHVATGMTFEVYDKFSGIPALGQDGLRPTDMPVGKASIEIMRVNSGSSECRIIRKTLGQEVVEGDYIANMVYDAKTKFNFVVYGAFDLDQNGVSASSDAEVIKRLITQWGGKVQTAITADTDFLIMGKEPVIPEMTAEQMADPVQQHQHEEATAASNLYQEVLTKATQLHIPVMNQNRFLYFCGYYSQAPR